MSSFALPALMASALALAQSAQPVPAEAQAHGSTPIVMSYASVIACAGVTQAMSELEGGESDQGRRLYDVALYWSLSAIQLAQATGKSDLRTEQDMTNARIRAVRELHNRDPHTLEHLDKCMKSAPGLD